MPNEMDAETKAFCDHMIEADDPVKYKLGRESLEWNAGDRAERIAAMVAAARKSKTAEPAAPPTTPPTAAPTVAPATKYRFPFDDVGMSQIQGNLKSRNSEELRDILFRITYGKLPSTGEYVPYSRLRPMICAIGLLLNHKGQIAPRFRPIRKYREFKNRAAREFSNDLQVLDLHWLSLHGNVLPERKWEKVFTPDFDFSMASEFVEKLKTAANKATALGITEQTQLLLSVINSKSVADRWITISKGMREAEIKLNAIAAIKTSRLDQATIPERFNEYVSLRISRGSPKAAAEVLPFIAGATTTARAMQKRRDWFTAKGIAAD